MRNNDPKTLDELKADLESCEKKQAFMKSANIYFRKNGTCFGCPDVDNAMANKLHYKMENGHSWERQQPFSSYDLTNNNSMIKRLSSKIKEVSQGFAGWEFNGGHAEANEKIDRLQLFFDERPDKEMHSTLRHAGFVFSHTNDAYQRQLTDNAIYSAGRIDFLKPTDGKTVREHQPKAPKRNEMER